MLVATVASAGAAFVATLAATKAAVPHHPTWWIRFFYFNVAGWAPLICVLLLYRTSRANRLRALAAWYIGCLLGLVLAFGLLAAIEQIDSSLASPRSVGSIIGSGLYIAPGVLIWLIVQVVAKVRTTSAEE